MNIKNSFKNTILSQKH